MRSTLLDLLPPRAVTTAALGTSGAIKVAAGALKRDTRHMAGQVIAVRLVDMIECYRVKRCALAGARCERREVAIGTD